MYDYAALVHGGELEASAKMLVPADVYLLLDLHREDDALLVDFLYSLAVFINVARGCVGTVAHINIILNLIYYR